MVVQVLALVSVVLEALQIDVLAGSIGSGDTRHLLGQTRFSGSTCYF